MEFAGAGHGMMEGEGLKVETIKAPKLLHMLSPAVVNPQRGGVGVALGAGRSGDLHGSQRPKGVETPFGKSGRLHMFISRTWSITRSILFDALR